MDNKFRFIESSSTGLTEFPVVLTFSVTMVHLLYQNWETNIGTILLTELQTLLWFHWFPPPNPAPSFPAPSPAQHVTCRHQTNFFYSSLRQFLRPSWFWFLFIIYFFDDIDSVKK